LATETLPPVIPSSDLAKNKTTNGMVMSKVPIMAELILRRLIAGKRNAKRKIIQPTNVQQLLIKRTFFLP
jgi:hypothetical protein